MHRRNVRARVAVGAAVLAIAGSAAIAPLSASATTAPPSTEPTSSEPVGESVPESSEAEVPELDEERAALVDGIVDASDDAGVPLDWDCVAVLVAQVSDADVAVIASQITAEVQATEATAEAEEVPEESEATEESDVTDDSAATTESAIETGVTDTTVTMESMPALSPEAEALAQLLHAEARG